MSSRASVNAARFDFHWSFADPAKVVLNLTKLKSDGVIKLKGVHVRSVLLLHYAIIIARPSAHKHGVRVP